MVDRTQAPAIHSKRSKRRNKKLQKKTRKTAPGGSSFLDLSYDTLLAILALLRPSDVFVFTRVRKGLHSVILLEEHRIGNAIIDLRYRILAKCFPLPVLGEHMDPVAANALLARRSDLLPKDR